MLVYHRCGHYLYFAESGFDGFALCDDYAFNANPFFPPDQFELFIKPYLKRIIRTYRDLGKYVIKHTDGNIMPILDALVDCNPHALHSLDPQGRVDIAEVKRRTAGKVALCGNVNCGLLQTGTEEEALASCEYAMRNGKPGGGYIFCTSNCAFKGLPLERYELMHRFWLENRDYD
jgi:uroporphyrinogen decarboxylase